MELLEKFQGNCLAILESKGLNPGQVLKLKLKMKEERAQFLQQQTLCNSKVNDFTTALEEMEQLLEM